MSASFLLSLRYFMSFTPSSQELMLRDKKSMNFLLQQERETAVPRQRVGLLLLRQFYFS